MNRFALSALALAALAACGKKSEAPVAETAASAAATVPATSKALTSGIDKANFDTSVRPQDDLYHAVDGNWLKSTPIPADKSNYGAFTKLDDDAEAQIKDIVESLAAKKDKAPGSEEQKIGDLYADFMDETKVEELGIKPLQPLLDQIGAIKDKKELVALMASFAKQGISVPVRAGVGQDDKDSTHYIPGFGQDGLGLPDRDYYLQDDAKFKGIRAAYLAHVEKMLGMAGVKDAAKAAKDIMALETRLAKAQWDKVKNRDPVATYNKFETAKFATLTKDFDFAEYSKSLGFGGEPAVLVAQPDYVAAFGKAYKEVPLETWKLYFQWHALSDAAPMLSKPFVDENFAFYSTTLNGIPENRPRWKRGVKFVEAGIGEAVGKIYVAKYFPAENKARMEKLVSNLIKTYDQEFDTLDWMSAETKVKAKEKLAKIMVKIGYPKEWRDYSALEVKPGDLLGNAQRAAEFEYNRNLAKLGKPIDRNEWGMTPQTVNAYYNPGMNEIVFPAAILQPPFFDVNAEDAVNYGGIGAVIGHEISHGFDDQGSQYDGDGNLQSWWTADDRKKFEAKTAALATQYDAYEPVKGYKLNGKFTLGENIADLGGLTIAQKAYHLSLEGKDAPELDGFTGDQRLFMGWAQVWRRNYREQNLIVRIKTDPHSPSEFRANGTPVNVPAFYTAFGVKEGDKMFKPAAERLTIW
jgi:putative endopeptidase